MDGLECKYRIRQRKWFRSVTGKEKRLLCIHRNSGLLKWKFKGYVQDHLVNPFIVGQGNILIIETFVHVTFQSLSIDLLNLYIFRRIFCCTFYQLVYFFSFCSIFPYFLTSYLGHSEITQTILYVTLYIFLCAHIHIQTNVYFKLF